MNHECHCQSLNRKLLLLPPETDFDADAVDGIAAGLGWTAVDSLDAYEVPLGPGQQFEALGQLSDFLRGLYPQAHEHFRIAWLDPGRPLSRQFAALADARPLSEVAPRRDSLITAILGARAIETWFQPIFMLRDMMLWGYECLMRARDTDGRLVNPGRIIEMAREENLTFVLDRVCRECHIENATKAGVPPHCRLLINFLPTVIYQPEVCLRTTLAAVERCGISHDRIIFEVVESELVEDRDKLCRILDFYRREGFGVALDDMGAGYSGLNMMADLSPDLIKIDRELISRSVKSSMHRSVCRAIAELGRSEGKLVLAEGVETKAELEIMRDLEVDLVQGFLFGRPQPEPVVTPLSF